jgi:hypothetical protein
VLSINVIIRIRELWTESLSIPIVANSSQPAVQNGRWPPNSAMPTCQSTWDVFTGEHSTHLVHRERRTHWKRGAQYPDRLVFRFDNWATPAIIPLVDAGKTLHTAVKRYVGESAPIQCCQVHRRCNVLDRLQRCQASAEDAAGGNVDVHHASPPDGLSNAGRRRRVGYARAATFNGESGDPAEGLRQHGSQFL